MTDVHKFLADLESKADAATSGPWANTANVKEMFGVEPFDWWKVYAKNPKDGFYPMTVCSMSHRATGDEQASARKEALEKGIITYDPGQAGKDADFIAAANPEAVKRLIRMVRYLADSAGENPDGDSICAYQDLHLEGKRCPLFKDPHHELGENASDDEWYNYVFGDFYRDELACSANTSKCWLYAAYKNTEPTP